MKEPPGIRTSSRVQSSGHFSYIVDQLEFAPPEGRHRFESLSLFNGGPRLVSNNAHQSETDTMQIFDPLDQLPSRVFFLLRSRGRTMSLDSIKTVAVLGAGTMGNGIAHVFARAGYNVMLRDVDRSFLERALDTIGKNLDREVKKGKLPESESLPSFAHKNCESTWPPSRRRLRRRSRPRKIRNQARCPQRSRQILRPEVILASNTSSISMTTLAALTSRPDRSSACTS